MIATTIATLLLAFAQVESSGNLHATGDHGKAQGLYQFHRDRWAEYGGDPAHWRTATRAEQNAAMVTALAHYIERKPPGVDLVRWVGTSHNAGHGIDRETEYVQKLRKEIEKLKQ